MNGTEKKELGHATIVLAENHRPHMVFGGVHLVFLAISSSSRR